MKKIALIVMAAGLFTVSCSSDDNNNSNGNATAESFLPSTAGNYWVYDTSTSTGSGRDSLYVANDTVIGTNSYKKYKTAEAPTGFYSGALSGNAVRQSNGKLILTGSTSFAFSSDLPLSIDVTDFTFFDANATSGTTLGTTSGTITQPTEDGYTISVNYTLTAVAQDSLAAYTVPNTTHSYTSLKTVKMTLSLSIQALFDIGGGITLPATVMSNQPVLVSTQYYAENIGAVYISTDINYTLQDLSQYDITLPIPQSGSEHQDEILDAYHIQ